jgi:hypothetical protein
MTAKNEQRQGQKQKQKQRQRQQPLAQRARRKNGKVAKEDGGAG